MSLKKWLYDTYNIKLISLDGLGKSGYYIHDEKIMFVNPDLSEEKLITVVLHELGHHLKDRDVLGDYKDYVARSKMEYLANSYMISNLLDRWCNSNNIEFKDVNCVTFLEVNDLSLNYIPIVEKVLSSKVSHA